MSCLHYRRVIRVTDIADLEIAKILGLLCSHLRSPGEQQ